MKIINENSVYVQKNDIIYLNHSDIEIPASIFMKIFGNGIVIIDNSNRYEFVEFNKPEEINFFKDIDWIIDYDEVKDLSEEEIIELGQKICDQQNIIANKFNSMSEKDKIKRTDIISQYELLDFKLNSLKDFLWFKQGHIKMKLPEGIDYPVDYVQEKGIKKLIKTIFNRK